MKMRYTVAVLCAAVTAGCAPPFQSVLHPAGYHASRIHDLFILFSVVVSLVWIVVMATLAYAVHRGRRRETAAMDEQSRRRAITAVGVAASATVLILIGLLTADLLVGRDLADRSQEAPAVTIVLTGNQWWWEARYEHADADLSATTANELRIPVGRPVMVKLKSRDVIHSLWVPNLNGKRDLVPGYTNTVWLRADSAGVYRGQCAEYCGHQHAHMALTIIAESPADFNAWLENELRPAVEPADDVLRRGQEVFMGSACVLCHTIRGTTAGGRTGPELTHVGSRRSIAAGTLSRSAENLARWIADPHAIKPGVHMPQVPLAEADRQAVAAYLESLK